jgi:hypothetical protein
LVPRGCGGAGQAFDRPGAGGEPAKVARQVGYRLAVTGVTERLQHRGKVFLGQKVRRRPLCQPPPGQQQKSGRPDIVTRLRQKHRIAQGGFILDTARLPGGKRGGLQRQPLPPGAGPAFLPTHHSVERAKRGAGSERGVLKRRKALRGTASGIENTPAQPVRHRRDRHGRKGDRVCAMAK